MHTGSAHEAAWHLMGFRMHQDVPNVVCLQIHTPDDHTITWQDGDALREVVAHNANCDTMLTVFLKLNAHTDPAVRILATSLLYQELPQHCRWKLPEHRWQPYIHDRFALVRMYYAGFNQGEKYIVWMLLTVVQGPTYFESLHTHEGLVHPTFRDCCLA